VSDPETTDPEPQPETVEVAETAASETEATPEPVVVEQGEADPVEPGPQTKAERIAARRAKAGVVATVPEPVNGEDLLD